MDESKDNFSPPIKDEGVIIDLQRSPSNASSDHHKYDPFAWPPDLNMAKLHG